MNRRNIRVVGGADSPEVAADVQSAAADEAATTGGGGFWAFVAWYAKLLVGTAVLLALVCATYGLWLGIVAAWNWIGL